tara:strand:+ start:123 stop:1910 length:1788 start_codon:yes stop_codon:yes gene_type:complete
MNEEEEKVKESLMINPVSFPEEKFTKDGKSYYYTRGDGTPITNESWSLKDLAYPLNVPFGGKRQGNLSDWAFTSWLVNTAPSQLAPIGALSKGIPKIRNQRILNKYKKQFMKVDENLDIADSFNVTPKNSAHLINKLDGYFAKELIPKYSSGAVVQTKDGTLYRPEQGTMTSTFMSTLDNLRDSQRKAYLERKGATSVDKTKTDELDPEVKKKKLNIKPPTPLVDKRAVTKYNAILNNKLLYPSIEEMNFALRPQSKRQKGERYKRPDRTSNKQWEIIGKRLQQDHGGTDAELKEFIKRQKLANDSLERDIELENQLHQLNYLSMAQEMIDKDMLEGVESMEDLYGNPVAIQDVDDFMYVQYLRMAQKKSKADVMEKGHIIAAKKIWEKSEHPLTTADYESNIRSEMRRSIRDYNHPKATPLKMIKGKDKEGRTTYQFQGGHLVEPGNIHRSHSHDLPDMMNLLLGTMPNVETEYMRFLGDLGYAVSPKQSIPKEAHFISYVRKRWRKWQGYGKTHIHGKQQLDQFPKVLNQIIDDYLNALDEGQFLSNPAASDAIDHMLEDKKTGVHQQRQKEAERRTIIRKINSLEDLLPDDD